MTWGHFHPLWRSWRATTAWSLTHCSGSLRSRLRSPPWRDTWTNGGRWTARSNGRSFWCRGPCRSSRVGRNLLTLSALRLSWGWRSSSTCCWRIWISLKLAEWRTDICKWLAWFFGIRRVCISDVGLLLHCCLDVFIFFVQFYIFLNIYILEHALIYIHMYLFMYSFYKKMYFKSLIVTKSLQDDCLVGWMQTNFCFAQK